MIAPPAKLRLRALGWFVARWAAVLAFVAGGGASVCPCCGSQACPVGFAGAAMVGFLVTALLYVPRWLGRVFRRRAVKRLDRDVSVETAHACQCCVAPALMHSNKR